MPTYYTAPVADGTITDLRSFALRCARAMGALITMRDEPADAPLPDRLEPSDFYERKCAEIQQSLDEVRAMGPQGRQAAAAAAHADRRKMLEEGLEREVAERSRHEAMIAQVEAWEGAPEGIKTFMLEQLRLSLSAVHSDFYADELAKLAPQSGDEWKVAREQELMRESAYYAKARQEEIDRTAGRNAWLQQLRASLPDEAA